MRSAVARRVHRGYILSDVRDSRHRRIDRISRRVMRVDKQAGNIQAQRVHAHGVVENRVERQVVPGRPRAIRVSRPRWRDRRRIERRETAAPPRQPSGEPRCGAASRESAPQAAAVGRLPRRRRRRSRLACKADSTQSAGNGSQPGSRPDQPVRRDMPEGTSSRARHNSLSCASGSNPLGGKSNRSWRNIGIGRADARRAWLRKRS